MIRVHVELFGPFEADFGATEIEQTLPDGATLRDLIEALVERSPRSRLADALDPSGRLHPYIYVTVNGAPVDRAESLGQRLADGARIAFAVPMAGGAPQGRRHLGSRHRRCGCRRPDPYAARPSRT